jgi:hypothetical protein
VQAFDIVSLGAVIGIDQQGSGEKAFGGSMQQKSSFLNSNSKVFMKSCCASKPLCKNASPRSLSAL